MSLMTPRHPLAVGDPAPWFSMGARSFDEMAGRHIVLLFCGGPGPFQIAQAITELERHADRFDGEHASLVCIGASEREPSRAAARAGLHEFADPEGTVAALYGVAPTTPMADARPALAAPVAFVLSPTLQVLEIVAWTESALAFARQVLSFVGQHIDASPAFTDAPVLTVPRVLDLDLCRELVEIHTAAGGQETGFGSGGELDRAFKRRLDCPIDDPQTRRKISDQLQRRLLMTVYRTFQFGTTRIERFLVACYDSATGGYFRPHRDNVTPATAHRRFAVTINLNADYEGGDLRFLEFSRRTYRPPVGGAIVFSCSLLHEVVPITAGRRYAFLSFFFDEPSARLLEDARSGAVTKA
jgi:predicted 2-oxoglutarate/Fe(II)-dependent dioxygenase YbiX